MHDRRVSLSFFIYRKGQLIDIAFHDGFLRAIRSSCVCTYIGASLRGASMSASGSSLRSRVGSMKFPSSFPILRNLRLFIDTRSRITWTPCEQSIFDNNNDDTEF